MHNRVGGAHGRERGCDDRHQVGSVSGVLRRVPYAKIQGALLNILQHDGSWERPLAHEPEELCQDGCAAGHRIKLADAGDHNGPSNTSWVPKDSPIYASLVTPELDGSQGVSEAFDLGYRLHKLQSDARSVNAAHSCIVQTAQHGLVDTLKVLWYVRHGRERNEEEIDADFAVLHLNKRNEGFRDRVHLGDVLFIRHVPEDALEVIEVVWQRDMFGRNNERIDVRG